MELKIFWGMLTYLVLKIFPSFSPEYIASFPSKMLPSSNIKNVLSAYIYQSIIIVDLLNLLMLIMPY